jgi:hypothetical protein
MKSALRLFHYTDARLKKTYLKGEVRLARDVIHTYYDNIQLDVNKTLYGSVE